jgi:hypothetical protein
MFRYKAATGRGWNALPEKALKQWNRAGQSGEEKKILLMYNQNIQAYCLCVNLF